MIYKIDINRPTSSNIDSQMNMTESIFQASI